jgi:endonuclease/exonuclease/phosphatase family metal-dependent hydrolase
VFRHGGGWRLDHVFASAELEPAAATYHHAWRDGGLSDHSALEVDLRPRPARG